MSAFKLWHPLVFICYILKRLLPEKEKSLHLLTVQTFSSDLKLMSVLMLYTYLDVQHWHVYKISVRVSPK